MRWLAFALLGYGLYTALSAQGRRFAVILPNGETLYFDAITPELDAALRAGGTPVLMEGDAVVHEYVATQFMGGWLLDNCPLNAVLGFGWLEGQVEALQDAGLRPTCPVV